MNDISHDARRLGVERLADLSRRPRSDLPPAWCAIFLLALLLLSCAGAIALLQAALIALLGHG